MQAIRPSRTIGPFTDRHQPWCRIFHNPGLTTECWCDSQIAVSAYMLGVAEGMAMLTLQRSQQEREPSPADDLVSVNALPEVTDARD